MKHRIIISGLAVIVLGALCLVAAETAGSRRAVPAIIPAPMELESQPGTFALGPATRILTEPSGQPTAEMLAGQLRRATGWPFRVEPLASSSSSSRNVILLETRANLELSDEGYELAVATDSVRLRATGSSGLFYGMQTLLQALPPEVFARKPVSGVDWKVPGLRIRDWPRFKWRGFMLDVSRHFFNKDEIEQTLDLMALHKLNVFHWHLTDDHGWRVEIKKYPRLTEVGAWRKGIGFGLDPKSTTAYGPDGRYGGFYTQADVREIVAYAQARHITIVPEIEMPGHSCAALAAYPDLGCTGGPYAVANDTGVFRGVYCAGNEKTFEFLQNVLAEVMELFPGTFIHVGGDEAPKTPWQHCLKCQARMQEEGLSSAEELQSYFMRRVEGFLEAHGRRLLGWSEIAEGGLAPGATVMDWKGGAVAAVRSGHDVVMSPTSHCYLDYYQSTERAIEPRAIGGYLPLRQVYSFEPIPAELGATNAHILGAQANLWTEYVPSLQQAQYMVFPRLCAIAEVVWGKPAGKGRDFRDFRRRLQAQFRRFDQLGVNCRSRAAE